MYEVEAYHLGSDAGSVFSPAGLSVHPMVVLGWALLALTSLLALSVYQSHCNPLVIKRFPESCWEIYKFPAAFS